MPIKRVIVTHDCKMGNRFLKKGQEFDYDEEDRKQVDEVALLNMSQRLLDITPTNPAAKENKTRILKEIEDAAQATVRADAPDLSNIVSVQVDKAVEPIKAGLESKVNAALARLDSVITDAVEAAVARRLPPKGK